MYEKPTYEELEKQVLEFKKAELKHKRLESLLKNEIFRRQILVRQSRDGIVVLDQDGKVYEANKRYADMLGYSMEEIHQLHVWDWDSQFTKEQLIEMIRSVDDAGAHFETRQRRKDGILLDVEISTNGAVYGEQKLVFCICRDITGRKRSDEALRESEERFRQVYNHMSIGVAKVSLEFKIESANPAYCKMLGYHEEELIGKHLREITHSDVLEENLAKQSQLASGAIDYFRLEKRFIHKNSNIVHGILDASLVRDGDGKPLYFLGSVSDITERKQAEQILKESEERFRNLMENIDAVAVQGYGPDGTTQYWNKASERLYGYNQQEAIGCNLLDLIIPSEMKDDVAKSIREMAESGQPIPSGELLLMHKDGSRVPVISHHAIVGVPGLKQELFCLDVDITERKRAEDELMRRQLMLARTERVAHVGSWEWYIATDTVTWSDELFRIFQRNPREGAPSFAEHNGFYHPDDMVLLRQAVETTVTQGTPYELELRAIRKDGETRVCIARGVAEMAPNGSAVRLFGSLQDITERKQAEEALQRSEAKYRSMMEAMKDSVYICSSNLRIEYMNPRMVSRVGRNATGDYCYKAIYGSDEKCSWCVFDNILQGDHIDYELADPRDNRYYSVTNSPIYHSSGTISKLTIFRDITDNKSIEAQLHHARKMESIGTMAGGIAHDFNNILYMITGNAELAMEDIPEWNPIHENLKEIKSAGLRAAGVVKQLLNFSRQTDQELRPIGAVMVIRESLKFLRSTIPTSIEIQQKFPDKEVVILGDPTQVNQVMMNLCINASQAMEETGGVLDILVETITLNEKANDSYSDLTTGDWLKITVNDTGPGIRSDIIDRIFDPYFTTKDVGKGSGMGLAVVHGIVKNHHGTISVESELGKGAAFTIFFPVATQRPAKDASVLDVIPRGAGERVLFVDDEAYITNMTGKMLERLGYKVRTATSPVDALELFRANPDAFDLVLTDMTMPKMTGVRLSEKLKEVSPDIPVVICTGHSALIDEEKAESIGIDGYTMKPIVMRDIAKAIRNVLDKAKGSAQR